MWPHNYVRRLLMRCQGRQVRDFAAVVVYSTYTGRFFEEVYDVPAERIAVAHNAIDRAGRER